MLDSAILPDFRSEVKLHFWLPCPKEFPTNRTSAAGMERSGIPVRVHGMVGFFTLCSYLLPVILLSGDLVSHHSVVGRSGGLGQLLAEVDTILDVRYMHKI